MSAVGAASVSLSHLASRRWVRPEQSTTTFSHDEDEYGASEAAEGLLPAVNDMLGHVDVLVCNHTHGGDAVGIANLTAAALDR